VPPLKNSVSAVLPPRAKADELLELLGFALIVLLPAIMSNFGLRSPETEHQSLYSQLGFVKELLGSLQFGLVASFFMTRHGRRSSWNDVATRDITWPIQVLTGIGLWFAYYLFFDFWGVVAALAGIRLPSIAWLHPNGGNELMLNGVFSVVNGFSEEIMRVYLLVQTQRAGLGKTGAALAVAVAMASYHFYQGAFTVLAFILAHVALNRFYISKRPLVALIVWHILSDFMHSTDLIGWGFVSEMANGAVAVGWLGLIRLYRTVPVPLHH
jgi:hypothetical protein